MKVGDILAAVRQAGAALRVAGDSLVASNASRIAPAIKAAIRENKPQIIAALAQPGGIACRVTIVELPAKGLRYRKAFAHLQLKPPDHVPVDRWQHAVEDGKRFLAMWGEQAESLGWTSADLFGLHTPPEKPHPSYRRLSRYDCTGLIWLLGGRSVIALTADTATIKNPTTGTTTTYRRHNKPGLGPGGDSLDDLK
jgi:hypothetical protein